MDMQPRSDYNADDIKVVDGWLREAAVATHPENEYADYLYNAELQCDVLEIRYDLRTRLGAVFIANGGCTDMSSCVDLFLRIDPYVRVIFTFSDGEPDTSYHQIERGAWTAGEGGRRYADDGEERSTRWRPRGRLRNIANGLAIFSGELNTAQAAKGEKELRDIQWRRLRAAKPTPAERAA